MTDDSAARLLVNGLGSKQVHSVRLLPVLVLRSEIKVENVSNDRSHLIPSKPLPQVHTLNITFCPMKVPSK